MMRTVRFCRVYRGRTETILEGRAHYPPPRRDRPSCGRARAGPSRRHLAGAGPRARASGRSTLAGDHRLASDASTPSAIAFASRRPGGRVFCFEHPIAAASGARRRRRGVSSLSLRASGAGRFSGLATRWRELTRFSGAVFPPTARTRRAPCRRWSPLLCPDGGHAPHWRCVRPASLVVPALSIALLRRPPRGGWERSPLSSSPTDLP